MKLDNQYASLPWGAALLTIIKERSNDLSPTLVVRGDDPIKLNEMLRELRAQPDTSVVRLGLSNSMAYAGIQILQGIDPAFSIEIRKANVRHELIHLLLRKKFSSTLTRSIIVIDRCQHLQSCQFFRVLRIINELEGKALILFLLPQDYAPKWFDGLTLERKPSLKFFLKLIPFKYAIGD